MPTATRSVMERYNVLWPGVASVETFAFLLLYSTLAFAQVLAVLGFGASATDPVLHRATFCFRTTAPLAI